MQRVQLQLLAWLLGKLIGLRKSIFDFEALVEKSPRKLFPEKNEKMQVFFSSNSFCNFCSKVQQ
jgi:hypothetical protein